MLRIAMMLILPCLIAADTTCPGRELKCPGGQRCCTVDSKQSCCDDAQLPSRSGLMSAAINSSVQSTDVLCSKSWCLGQCCSATACCPYEGDTCCAKGCCSKLNFCCGSDCCLRDDYKCCDGGFCCKKNQNCGPSYCYGGAGSLSPTALVTLVAAWLVAYAVKKL